jgi:hypothetical protein
MDLNELRNGTVCWIQLARERAQWQDVLKEMMTLLVPKKEKAIS